MTCERSPEIHRYHDGELTTDQRCSTEDHLRQCPDCRRLLADLRDLSLLLRRAELVPMPADLPRRLRHPRRLAEDMDIRRAAGWLTAAAAAVLAGAILVRSGARDVSEIRPTVWETVAVMPPADAQDDANAATVAMAQWMADELSSDNGDLR